MNRFPAQLTSQRFEVPAPNASFKIEALCINCGEDLIVVIGGGSHYHIGALGLTISLPSIKDQNKFTNSTYQIPVPGHKEESLARDASFKLSKDLKKNVVVSVGIHEDNLSKENILNYLSCFEQLIEIILENYKKQN